jgi:uncharacterized membrane protein YdjX (TVP38/TMEM64 family)
MISKTLIRGLFTIFLLVIFGWLVKVSGLDNIINQNWIDQNVRNNGVEGYLIFISVTAALVAIGFPRQIISFLSGYAFGFSLGTVLGLLTCGVGCAIAFLFARFVGREWVKSKFLHRLVKADQFFTANTFMTTLLIRFMPLGSNITTNLVAGVSGASAFSFISASILGYIPQTLIFALLGSGFNLDLKLRVILSLVLFAGSVLFGVYLYRKYKNSVRI